MDRQPSIRKAVRQYATQGRSCTRQVSRKTVRPAPAGGQINHQFMIGLPIRGNLQDSWTTHPAMSEEQLFAKLPRAGDRHHLGRYSSQVSVVTQVFRAEGERY